MNKKTFINPPSKCDICGGDFKNDCFYDAKTSQGPWCMQCMHDYGIGLGIGLGQEYQKQGNEWVKTEG